MVGHMLVHAARIARSMLAACVSIMRSMQVAYSGIACGIVRLFLPHAALVAPARFSSGPRLLPSAFGFADVCLPLFPAMQGVCVFTGASRRAFHPPAGQEQLHEFSRLSLPVGGDLDVVGVHAVQQAVRPLLRAKTPQDLQAAHGVQAALADQFDGLWMPPEIRR